MARRIPGQFDCSARSLGEPRASRLLFVPTLLLTPFVASLLRGEDIAFLRGEKPGEAELKLTGEVIDYTGRILSIKPSVGVARNFPGQRVARIESDWSPAQREGDQAFATGDFHAALQKYSTAIQSEQRGWVRRLLLAQLVWCYRNLGDYETAGERFLALIGSDPDTPYFDAIPLAWTTSETARPEKANAWLALRGQPVAQLLGASHLLAGGANPTATATIRELARSSDPRIAALATGQLWRTLILTAQPSDLQRWQDILDNMPEPLRAGPYYVRGQALARQGDAAGAALALLRPPLLYPRERVVAAESLLAAAGELVKLEQTADAERLYREVVAIYPGTKAAAAAQSRLERATPSGR